ncbi:sigma-70 family RNA polymerase sigma factor [Oceanobacillus alkalisoli]|uniref:sigma-70 family RNA polymerase sigma factor n=1 Tax=Oceanobacillus alkalisoli TaxID=2925113 RepID=UPI001F121EFE|nr:sigma-70 family RNA polymerase sigma factor [Oceanobacillus alkalisoli]MCF3942197.1 sigma-70 family RNA polymerase sigma factor [Oceanobacillus alkalisoli]
MNNMNSKQLENWADRLLAEYDEGWRGLNKTKDNLRDDFLPDQQDKTHINSMIDSMTYSIDWMRTGRQPDMYRGVDKKDKYRAKFYDDMDILPDINEELRKEREPLYITKDQRKALLQVFKNFSKRERQCYVMYEAENFSMQQIANRLGISKGTVQMYINRAREKVHAVAS